MGLLPHWPNTPFHGAAVEFLDRCWFRLFGKNLTDPFEMVSLLGKV